MPSNFDNILIIGEASAILRPLKDRLRDAGCRNVEYRSTVSESVRQTIVLNTGERKRILIIIDLDAKTFPAFDVLRQLREDGRHQRLAIIGLTGSPSPELVQNARDTGISSLLTKPLSSKKLLERVQTLSQSVAA